MLEVESAREYLRNLKDLKMGTAYAVPYKGHYMKVYLDHLGSMSNFTLYQDNELTILLKIPV